MALKRYTNNKGIPLVMAVWLAQDEYDHDPRPNVISVTALLKSTRAIILNSRLEPSEGIPDISMLLAARMGTSLHSSIENAWVKKYRLGLAALGYPLKVIDKICINPDPDKVKKGTIPIYLERRTERKVGKWIISGSLDLVCDGFIIDVKSTGVSTYLKEYKNDDYIKQCSMYRWLNPDIITKEHLKIEFIFKDWSLIGSYSNPNYPPMPIHELTLPLMTKAQTEFFIKNKLGQLEMYWDAPESEIPECDDKELWIRETKWKYFGKVTNKKATKVFTNKYEASAFLASKGKGIVKEVKGMPLACVYCNAKCKCSQYARFVKDGIIKI